MSEFATFQKQKLVWNSQMFFPIDNAAGGNCNYLSMMDSGLLPCSNAFELRLAVAEFALGPGRLLAEHLFGQWGGQRSKQTFLQYFDRLKMDGVWSGSLEQCLVAALYGVDLISLSNTTEGLMEFRASMWMREHCKNVTDIECMIPDANATIIYIYHHQYQRPLHRLPNGSFQLNHFCALLPQDSGKPMRSVVG
jgi:hypothetical protein